MSVPPPIPSSAVEGAAMGGLDAASVGVGSAVAEGPVVALGSSLAVGTGVGDGTSVDGVAVAWGAVDGGAVGRGVGAGPSTRRRSAAAYTLLTPNRARTDRPLIWLITAHREPDVVLPAHSELQAPPWTSSTTVNRAPRSTAATLP
jgi:hypothetical protein